MCFASGAGAEARPAMAHDTGLDHDPAAWPSEPTRGEREPSPTEARATRTLSFSTSAVVRMSRLGRRPDDVRQEAGRLLPIPASALRMSRSTAYIVFSVLYRRSSARARQRCGEAFKISHLAWGHVVKEPGNVQKPPQNQQHVRRAACGCYLALLPLARGSIGARFLHFGIEVKFVSRRVPSD
jgi:hypothetical protein